MSVAAQVQGNGGAGASSTDARPQEPLAAFARLQQQVEQAVGALDRLRSENVRLQKELASAQEMLQLTQDELDRLVAERTEVCQRIQAVMSSLQQAGLGRSE